MSFLLQLILGAVVFVAVVVVVVLSATSHRRRKRNARIVRERTAHAMRTKGGLSLILDDPTDPQEALEVARARLLRCVDDIITAAAMEGAMTPDVIDALLEMRTVVEQVCAPVREVA